MRVSTSKKRPKHPRQSRATPKLRKQPAISPQKEESNYAGATSTYYQRKPFESRIKTQPERQVILQEIEKLRNGFYSSKSNL